MGTCIFIANRYQTSESDIWKLNNANGQKKKETHIPLNQVKASEVEGASKYKIAFESTILRAVKFPIINHVKLKLLRTQNPNLFLLTVSMYDARRLRHRLHPENGPEVNRGIWILPV